MVAQRHLKIHFPAMNHVTKQWPVVLVTGLFPGAGDIPTDIYLR